VAMAGKRGRRVNTVQKKWIHIYVNAKIIPVETIPGMRRGVKERGGEDEFKYDIFDTL
jgi:hypothetical protein